jgi:hypothetical protein
VFEKLKRKQHPSSFCFMMYFVKATDDAPSAAAAAAVKNEAKE